MDPNDAPGGSGSPAAAGSSVLVGAPSPHVEAAENPASSSDRRVSASGSPGDADVDSSVADPGSSVQQTVVVSPSMPWTHLQKGVLQPVNYKKVLKFGLACSTSEPQTLDEALGDTKWKQAMEELYKCHAPKQDSDVTADTRL